MYSIEAFLKDDVEIFTFVWDKKRVRCGLKKKKIKQVLKQKTLVLCEQAQINGKAAKIETGALEKSTGRWYTKPEKTLL